MAEINKTFKNLKVTGEAVWSTFLFHSFTCVAPPRLMDPEKGQQVIFNLNRQLPQL